MAILERLLAGLKAAGVEQGARNKTVAEKTGYTEKTVGNILSGNAKLTDRFIQAVCRSFGIDLGYVQDGIGYPLVPIRIIERTSEDIRRDAINRASQPGIISENMDRLLSTAMDPIVKDAQSIVMVNFYEMCRAARIPEIFIEGIKELEKMPESERYKAVGELKFRNELLQVEKEFDGLKKQELEKLK